MTSLNNMEKLLTMIRVSEIQRSTTLESEKNGKLLSLLNTFSDSELTWAFTLVSRYLSPPVRDSLSSYSSTLLNDWSTRKSRTSSQEQGVSVA